MIPTCLRRPSRWGAEAACGLAAASGAAHYAPRGGWGARQNPAAARWPQPGAAFAFAPLQENIFEWHFVIRGAWDSEFEVRALSERGASAHHVSAAAPRGEGLQHCQRPRCCGSPGPTGPRLAGHCLPLRRASLPPLPARCFWTCREHAAVLSLRSAPHVLLLNFSAPNHPALAAFLLWVLRRAESTMAASSCPPSTPSSRPPL